MCIDIYWCILVYFLACQKTFYIPFWGLHTCAVNCFFVISVSRRADLLYISYGLKQFADAKKFKEVEVHGGGGVTVREGDRQTGVKQIRGKKQSDRKYTPIKRSTKRESKLCRENRPGLVLCCAALLQKRVKVKQWKACVWLLLSARRCWREFLTHFFFRRHALCLK